MKTILVLTDLSEKAKNAALYALKLAEKTHSDIILFHSFEQFQTVNVPEAGGWAYEDYDLVKEGSLAELKKLKDYLWAQHDPAGFEPEIGLINEIGLDLASNAAMLTMSKEIDLIVMGTRSDDTLSHLFYGSDTYAVLEEADRPVLFIPPNCSFKPLETIVFANDFKKDYTNTISFLISIARINQSNIILPHFGSYDNAAFKCLNLIKNEFEYPNVTSRLICMENMDEQLKDFAAANHAGLVVMIHHKGLQIKKMIAGSRSKNMLKHNEVPVLIFPD